MMAEDSNIAPLPQMPERIWASQTPLSIGLLPECPGADQCGSWDNYIREDDAIEYVRADTLAAAPVNASMGEEPVAWQWNTVGVWRTAEKPSIADPEQYARSMAGAHGHVRPIYTAPRPSSELVAALRKIIARDSHIDATPRGNRQVIMGEFARIADTALRALTDEQG